MERHFTPWVLWNERNEVLEEHIGWPGIYVVAWSESGEAPIAGQKFSTIKEIIYVGMSNAVTGQKGRLRSFDNTIKFLDKPSQHGGADRVRNVHQIYDFFVSNLYVAICPYPCKPAEETARDLRVMGEVAKAEYEQMARYVDAFGVLPQFNRKKGIGEIRSCAKVTARA